MSKDHMWENIDESLLSILTLLLDWTLGLYHSTPARVKRNRTKAYQRLIGKHGKAYAAISPWISVRGSTPKIHG